MSERLDRIEAILDRLVERQDRTQVQLDGLATRQDQTQTQISDLATRQGQTQLQLDDLAVRQGQTQLQLNQVAVLQAQMQQEMNANFEALGRDIGQLIRGTVDLRQQVSDFGRLVEQDRSQAAIDRAEFRSTVDQLLQVLTERFTRNGDG